ncbi:hypothetical protein U1Q18_038613 [Sarracenia purpurea var. burkii]
MHASSPIPMGFTKDLSANLAHVIAGFHSKGQAYSSPERVGASEILSFPYGRRTSDRKKSLCAFEIACNSGEKSPPVLALAAGHRCFFPDLTEKTTVPKNSSGD